VGDPAIVDESVVGFSPKDDAPSAKDLGPATSGNVEFAVLSVFTAASTASSRKSSPLIKRSSGEIINTGKKKLEARDK
jgi:hypothetical protein